MDSRGPQRARLSVEMERKHQYVKAEWTETVFLCLRKQV